MLLPFHRLIVSATLLSVSATAQAQPRSEVNFAFGGATTSSANATDAFATQDPSLAQLLAAIRSQGLDVIGLEQQLDFARATLNDVQPAKDLFWVYAGINDYLSGGQDPSQGPARLAAVLHNLYTDVGARRFVVPNLPSLADLPLFAGMPAPVRDGLGQLTAAHNAILSGVLAQFVATHEGAVVTPVDVFSVFQEHKVSGEFSDVTHGCDTTLPAEQLPLPGACDGFLYLDIVHPASAAWLPVAQAVADALAGSDVDRIITLGDSFSDLGAMSDTFVRTVGFPFPLPPFTEGRFTESDNVVQQTEALLGVVVQSKPFAQPRTATQTVTCKTPGAVTGQIFVPKRLNGTGKSSAKVTLTFNDQKAKIDCKYNLTAGGYVLSKCSKKVRGGDLIQASTVQIRPNGEVETVTVDWLYY